jgi:molecular chaperone GrpE
MIEDQKQPETISEPLAETSEPSQESQTPNSLNLDEQMPIESSVDLDGEQTPEFLQDEGVIGIESNNDVKDSTQQEFLQIIEALQMENAALKQRLDQQTQQADMAKAQYVRMAADFDNVQKRAIKEKEELTYQVKRNTISELLPAIDSFEQARLQLKPNNEGEMFLHKSYQGVYKQLVEGLKRIGVSAMRPEGTEFDPNFHEAVFREQTDEYSEGIVIDQLVRGYLLGDRVLRHAMVKVAAPKEAVITSEEEDTAPEEGASSIPENGDVENLNE